MKTYEVLKDCKPFLVVGTITERSLKNSFSEKGILDLLFEKYIKEIQGPKWTDDDMQKYAIYCYSIPFGSGFTIEGWQKDKS